MADANTVLKHCGRNLVYATEHRTIMEHRTIVEVTAESACPRILARSSLTLTWERPRAASAAEALESTSRVSSGQRAVRKGLAT